MLPKDLLQVLKLSGGKVIVSEGDLEESYVVMSLAEYLKERREPSSKEKTLIEEETLIAEKDLEELEDGFGESKEIVSGEGLTNEKLLDRINADISELRQRKNELELEHEFEEGEEEGNEDYHYEKVSR